MNNVNSLNLHDLTARNDVWRNFIPVIPDRPVVKPENKISPVSKTLPPGIVATLAYLGTRGIFKTISKPLRDKAIDNLTAQCGGFTEANVDKMISEMVKKYRLEKVKTSHVDKNNVQKVFNSLMKGLREKSPKQAKLNEILGKISKAFSIKEMLKSVGKGENAFYFTPTNEIFLNRHKLPHVALHELGHASNAKQLKIFQTIARALPLMILMFGTVSLALQRGSTKLSEKINNKNIENVEKQIEAAKDEDIRQRLIGVKKFAEKSKSTSDKINKGMLSFYEHIKNHIGIYLLAGSVPMILEEAAASHKGIKIAKNTLKSKDLAQFKKSMGWALSTYAIGALITAGTAALAVRIWDNLRATKEASQSTNVAK